MNKIDIENIVKEKLSDFEYKSDNSDWESFEKKLPNKKINFSRYIIVASIIAIIVVAYNINKNNNKQVINKKQNIVINNNPKVNNQEKKQKVNVVVENNNNIEVNKSIKADNKSIKPENKQVDNNYKEIEIVEKIEVEENNTPDTEQIVTKDNYKPNANFTTNINKGCVPLDISCISVEEKQNIIYTWYFGDGTKSTEKKPNHLYNEPGKYIIKLTTKNINNSMTNSYQTEITVYEKPKAEFNYSVFDNTYYFKGIDCDKQIWKFGDNSFSNEITPEHNYSRIGKTIITYTAINEYGCKSEKQKTINIEPIFQIPNAFSPNNDGDNDEFGPIFSNLINYNYYLFVYDAYGKLIFESQTENKNWKGEIKNSNKIADKGIYLWKLIISDKYENKVIKKGKLTIK